MTIINVSSDVVLFWLAGLAAVGLVIAAAGAAAATLLKRSEDARRERGGKWQEGGR